MPNLISIFDVDLDLASWLRYALLNIIGSLSNDDGDAEDNAL